MSYRRPAEVPAPSLTEIRDVYGVAAALGKPLDAPREAVIYWVNVMGPNGKSWDVGENIYAATAEDANQLADHIFIRKILGWIVQFSSETALFKPINAMSKKACSLCGGRQHWSAHTLQNAYTVSYWVRQGVSLQDIISSGILIQPDTPAYYGKYTTMDFSCRNCRENNRTGREEVDLLDYPEIFEHDFMMAMAVSGGYQINVHPVVLSAPSFATEISLKR